MAAIESVVFDGGVLDGGGPRSANGIPITRPDPTREYVSGGDGYSMQSLPKVLPTTIDELTRMLGFRSYEAMQTHPAIHASTLTLKLGIMADEIRLVETHPIEAGEQELTPEQRLSADVKAFCQRLMDRVTDFRSKVFRLLDCVVDGNKVGEIVAREAITGPDEGRLVLDRINVKSRHVWEFVVDRSLNVTGYRFRDGTSYRILPPYKFLRFTWLPKDNDPRGRTVLRPAYMAWNMCVQLYPQYYKYLKQFGAPSLIGTTAPLAKNETVSGKVLTAQEFMLLQLEKFQNGSALVVPNGATVQPIVPPAGAASPFLDAFSHLHQEMTLAILMQTRATREAQFGSKADSESGQNVLGLLLGYGREMSGDALRDGLFKLFVSVNFGQEIADVYTPYVYMGAVDPRNVAELWNALANLYRAGAVTDSVRAEFHARVNAPIPDVAADNEAEETKAARAAEAVRGPASGAARGMGGQDGDGKGESNDQR